MPLPSPRRSRSYCHRPQGVSAISAAGGWAALILIVSSLSITSCVSEGEARAREGLARAQQVAQFQDRVGRVEAATRANELQQIRLEMSELVRARGGTTGPQDTSPSPGEQSSARGAFENTTGRAVDISAVNSERGEEVPLGRVEAGGSLQVGLRPGSLWRLRINGWVIAEFVASDEGDSAVDIAAISDAWLAQSEPRVPVASVAPKAIAVDGEATPPPPKDVVRTFDNTGGKESIEIVSVLNDPATGDEVAVPYATLEAGKKVDLYVAPSGLWRVVRAGGSGVEDDVLAEYVPTTATHRTVAIPDLISAYAGQTTKKKLPMTIMGGPGEGEPETFVPVAAPGAPAAPTVLCTFVNDFLARAADGQETAPADLDLIEISADSATGNDLSVPRMRLPSGGQVSLYVAAGSRWQIRSGPAVVAEFQPGDSLATRVHLNALAAAWGGPTNNQRGPMTTARNHSVAVAADDFVTATEASRLANGPAKRTFTNNLDQRVELSMVAQLDDSDGLSALRYARLEPGQSVGVSAVDGMIWRFAAEGEVIAEFAEHADDGVVQARELDIAQIRSVWWNQAEPRSPRTLKDIEYAQRDDPEGRWVAKSVIEDQTKLIYESYLVTKIDGGSLLDFELTTGDHWLFRRGPRAIYDFWYFVGATDARGVPIFSVLDERTRFTVFEGDSGRLSINGETYGEILLLRDRSGDASLRIANALSQDKLWDSWVAKDQDAGWHHWSADERAGVGITEGFSGELIASQRPSYLGFNVCRMNPDQLADEPGTQDRLHPIFKITEDNSREWSTYGSGYRIPWSFLMQPYVRGRSKTHMEAYTSSRQRQEAVSKCVSYGGPVSLSTNSENLAMDELGKGCLRASRWASEYWLILHKAYAKLDSQFVRAVMGLPKSSGSPNDMAAYTRFFETYGTHYPVATLYGGRAYLEQYTKRDVIETAVSAETELKLELQPTATVQGIGASWNSKTSSANRKSDSNRTAVESEDKVYAYSGGAGGWFDSWDIGENKKLVPIQVALRPIEELLIFKLMQAASGPRLDPDEVKALAAAVSAARAQYQSTMDSEASHRAAAAQMLNNNPETQECTFELLGLHLGRDDNKGDTVRPYGKIVVSAPGSTTKVGENTVFERSEADAESAPWAQGTRLDIQQKLKFTFPSVVPLTKRNVIVDIRLTDYDDCTACVNGPMSHVFTVPVTVSGATDERTHMTTVPVPNGGTMTFGSSPWFNDVGEYYLIASWDTRPAQAPVNHTDIAPWPSPILGQP